MSPAHASLLSPSSPGFGGQTRSANYDALLDALYASGNTTTLIGDKLWVPWYASATSCQVRDLQQGSNCNAGEAIDAAHNCMVTDEFSQVGIMVAMGNSQERMDQFYRTVLAIPSTHGQLPGWRVYRSGSAIQQCRSGVNGNCDTASDADARVIISLFAASDNSLFANSQQKSRYYELAANLSRDFVANEVLYSCKPSSLGYGDICWWLAAGSGAKSGGMSSIDFGYSGYYADGIIAMLQACGQTGNQTYCHIAGNFTLNYLQAAKFDGTHFTVPPGRSFAWTNLGGIPEASCTNTCNPDQWDSADAPRALGMCQANYYAQQMDFTLPGLQQYCNIWGNRYMTASNSAPIQYFSDGTNSAGYQSGFFAQGLESLFQSGGHNPSLFGPTLDSALSHYSTTTRTFDWTGCFGVYTAGFSVRALGMGIGRDAASFPVISFSPGSDDGTGSNDGSEVTPDPAQTPALQNIGFLSVTPSAPAVIAEPNNQTFTYALSNPDHLATTTIWFLNGLYQSLAYNHDAFLFLGNYSTAGIWNITVIIASSKNTLRHEYQLFVSDTADPLSSQHSNANDTSGNDSTGNVSPAKTPVPTPTANLTQNSTQNDTLAENPTQGNVMLNDADENSTASDNATPLQNGTTLPQDSGNATLETPPQNTAENMTLNATNSTANSAQDNALSADTAFGSIGSGGGGGGGGGIIASNLAKAKQKGSGAGNSTASSGGSKKPGSARPAPSSAKLQQAVRAAPVAESPAVTGASQALQPEITTLPASKERLSWMLIGAILLACLALVYVIETSSRHIIRQRFGHYTIGFARHVAVHGHRHVRSAAIAVHARTRAAALHIAAHVKRVSARVGKASAQAAQTADNAHSPGQAHLGGHAIRPTPMQRQ